MKYKGYEVENIHTDSKGNVEARIKGTDIVFTSTHDFISSFKRAVDTMPVNSKPTKKVYNKVKKGIITPNAEYEMELPKEEE